MPIFVPVKIEVSPQEPSYRKELTAGGNVSIMNAAPMDEQAQTRERPTILSEVLEREYNALGIPVDIRDEDFPEFPGDDSRRLNAVCRQASAVRPCQRFVYPAAGFAARHFHLV